MERDRVGVSSWWVGLSVCLLLTTVHGNNPWGFSVSEDAFMPATLEAITSIAVFNYKNSTVIYAAVYRTRISSGHGSYHHRNEYYLVVRSADGKKSYTTNLPIEMPNLIDTLVGGRILVYSDNYFRRFDFDEYSWTLSATDQIPISTPQLSLMKADPYSPDFAISLDYLTFAYCDFSSSFRQGRPGCSHWYLEIMGEQQTFAFNDKHIIRFSHTQKAIWVHDKHDTRLRVVKHYEFGKELKATYTHMYATADRLYCVASTDLSYSVVVFDLSLPQVSTIATSASLNGEVTNLAFDQDLNMVLVSSFVGNSVSYWSLKIDEKSSQLSVQAIEAPRQITLASSFVSLDGKIYNFAGLRLDNATLGTLPMTLDPSQCVITESSPGVTCRHCLSFLVSKCEGKTGQLPAIGMGLDLITLKTRPCTDPNCGSCAQNFRVCTECAKGYRLSPYTSTCSVQAASPSALKRSLATLQAAILDMNEEDKAFSSIKNYIMTE